MAMTRSRSTLGAILAAALLASTGCLEQRILAPEMSPERSPGAEFKNQGYTWYLFFGTIEIYTARVPELIAEVNPNQNYLYSWKATSKENWVACLVNIANLGILVSMHSVEVEGRFAGP
jgi:hypothetical protein